MRPAEPGDLERVVALPPGGRHGHGEPGLRLDPLGRAAPLAEGWGYPRTGAGPCSAAWPAAILATCTRYGEHDT